MEPLPLYNRLGVTAMLKLEPFQVVAEVADHFRSDYATSEMNGHKIISSLSVDYISARTNAACRCILMISSTKTSIMIANIRHFSVTNQPKTISTTMPILPSRIDSTPRQIKRNADKKKKVGIGKPSLPLDQENYFLTIFRSLLALSPYSIYTSSPSACRSKGGYTPERHRRPCRSSGRHRRCVGSPRPIRNTRLYRHRRPLAICRSSIL